MENTTKYIDDILYSIKRVLSNPESALFLQELYYEEYHSVLASNEEMVLGAVLKRKTESVEDFNMLSYVTKDYKRYDIKKFFGLTLVEFLDSTAFFKRTIIKEAKIAMEELRIEMANVQAGTENEVKRLEEFNQ